MPAAPRVYRAPRWLVGFLASTAMASAAGAILLASEQGQTWWAIGLAALAVLFLVGVAESWTMRVALHEDALEMVANFRRTVIARSELRRVVAEKGAPMAIERTSGGWVRLPPTTGPHLDTLRAWLRRGGSAIRPGGEPQEAE